MATETEWFREWFNSPYYHVLYAHRTYTEAEAFIKRITAHLELPAGARVLDAACGKGRHSLTLHQLGFETTGVDISPESIREAKAAETAGLHFEVGDIRDVYKPAYFDVVFNLFSSFGYFDSNEEDIRVLKAFNQSLKPGGLLVLDYMNSEFIIKTLVPREIIERQDVQFHISRRVEGGFIKKNIQFLAPDGNHEYEEKLKVINQFHFEKMLERAGFTLLQRFGDYALSPFVSSRSPRLILVAQTQAH